MEAATTAAFPRVVEPLLEVVVDVQASCLQDVLFAFADPLPPRGLVLDVDVGQVGGVDGSVNGGGGGGLSDGGCGRRRDASPKSRALLTARVPAGPVRPVTASATAVRSAAGLALCCSERDGRRWTRGERVGDGVGGAESVREGAEFCLDEETAAFTRRCTRCALDRQLNAIKTMQKLSCYSHPVRSTHVTPPRSTATGHTDGAPTPRSPKRQLSQTAGLDVHGQKTWTKNPSRRNSAAEVT